MNTDAIPALKRLIDDLEASTPLALDEIRAMNDPFRRDVYNKLFDSGGTYGQVSGSPVGKLLTGDTFQVKERLRSIANDLAAQVQIVTESVAFFRETGEPVPPGYAWRIAVILRKMKHYNLEARFLAAYNRHFCSRGLGRTEAALVDRLPKALALAAKFPSGDRG